MDGWLGVGVVVGVVGGKASEGRTGSNHWLKYDEDDVVQSIGKRIADIVGLPLAHAESMQIIHYGPEQEYRPHFDAFNLSLPRGQRAAKWGGPMPRGLPRIILSPT